MSQSASAVGVVIVTYNSRSHFPRQKAALEALETPAARIVVVDNASRPDERPLPGDFPLHAEILQMEANLGFAAANNLAVARLDTPLVALLNPDAFPEPDWLSRLVAGAAAAPDAAAFGSTQVSAEDPAVYDGLGDCYHVLGIPWRGGFGWPRASCAAPSGETFSACAAAALYRRTAWEAVGGFDESYFCYCEDVDLGFRLRLAGWRVMQVADAVVHHVGGASSGKQSDFAVYHGTRNRLWTHVKNMPGAAFWITLPLHLAVSLVLLVRARAAGLHAPTMRGLRDGVRGLPAVWRARSAVQRARRASAASVLRAMTWSIAALRRRAPDVRARR